MKSVIFSVILLAVIIFSGIIYTNEMQNLSEEFCVMNNKIAEYVVNGDFDAAGDECEKLDKYIKDKKVFIGSAVDHTELDSIELSLAKIDVFIAEKDKIEALAYLYALEIQLKHLPRNFKMRAENIL